MKKFIPLLFLIATISICSQSIYTAREGFTYLENIGAIDDYSVIEINAAGFIEYSLFEGKAPEWIYICKSDDIADTIFYEFKVNYDGGSFENELTSTPYYQGKIRNSQQYSTLMSNWEDSDKFGAKLEDIDQFAERYEYYKDISTASFILFLRNEPQEFTDVWGAYLSAEQDSPSICYFDSFSLEMISCNVPASVVEEYTEFDIFPNPAREFINIEADVNGMHNIEVYNPTGKIVKNIKSYFAGEAKINVADLENGIYNLIIRSGNKVYAQRCVIAR